MAGMFLGETGSSSDPLANPLHADPTGFPPIFITAGGDESLEDAVRLFADNAKAHGVPVELEIAPDMQHAFQWMAGRSPEADDSSRERVRASRTILTRRVDSRLSTLALKALGDLSFGLMGIGAIFCPDVNPCATDRPWTRSPRCSGHETGPTLVGPRYDVSETRAASFEFGLDRIFEGVPLARRPDATVQDRHTGRAGLGGPCPPSVTGRLARFGCDLKRTPCILLVWRQTSSCNRRCLMSFARFMAQPLGRGIRVLAGIALIAVGIAQQSPVGYVIAAIGVLPLLAGALNLCVLAPLLRAPFNGRRLVHTS
jgi:hypothetical protein